MDFDLLDNREKKNSIIHIGPGQWAGHMRIYQRECRTLVNSGFDVSLIAHAFPFDKIDSRIDFHSLGELPRDSFNLGIFNRIERSSKAFDISKSIKANLIHYYSPEFIPWAGKLKKNKKIPIIFDCMEDFEAYFLIRDGIPKILRSTISLLVSKLLEYAARTSDAVIFSDQGTSKKFINSAKRIEVIHNFPDLTIFDPSLESPSKKNYDIVFNGAVYKYTLTNCFNIDNELVKKGYKLKWLFFGLNPEEKWVNDQLRLRRIHDRFTFEGLIPQEEVPRKLQQARIGIIPLPDNEKFRNNIPQKLFEFMSLGIPVVMSDLPPSRELTGIEDCSKMVKPDDYLEYANAIISLLDNKSYCSDMAERAKTLIIEEYNWQMESKKLINLYNDLL